MGAPGASTPVNAVPSRRRRGKRERDRALYIGIHIAAPMDKVWELTQDPALHARWDARFSAIRPTGERADGATTFDYELSLGLHTIRGTGVSIGERRAANGTRTSALLFDTRDVLSPLGKGRGYWRYEPTSDGVYFSTGYDYAPGWGPLGRVLDPLITRRFVWWLTAWSFDRLRLWAESGIEPERVGWWRGWVHGPRARASRCVSDPPRHTRSAREADRPAPHDAAATGRIMSLAPATLQRIENYDDARPAVGE